MPEPSFSFRNSRRWTGLVESVQEELVTSRSASRGSQDQLRALKQEAQELQILRLPWRVIAKLASTQVDEGKNRVVKTLTRGRRGRHEFFDFGILLAMRALLLYVQHLCSKRNTLRSRYHQPS